MTVKFPPRKYPHPGFEVGPIALKIWEIRNQLEINLENSIQHNPVDEMTMKTFGHPVEMMNIHVFDRLDELEKLLEQ